jgi:DNA-binding transcriptional regulator YdaS (Cro superfamily)
VKSLGVKSLGVKSLGVKSLALKSLGVKSLGVKSLGVKNSSSSRIRISLRAQAPTASPAVRRAARIAPVAASRVMPAASRVATNKTTARKLAAKRATAISRARSQEIKDRTVSKHVA